VEPRAVDHPTFDIDGAILSDFDENALARALGLS
jgi:hypothetical protein